MQALRCSHDQPSRGELLRNAKPSGVYHHKHYRCVLKMSDAVILIQQLSPNRRAVAIRNDTTVTRHSSSLLMLRRASLDASLARGL